MDAAVRQFLARLYRNTAASHGRLPATWPPKPRHRSNTPRLIFWCRPVLAGLAAAVAAYARRVWGDGPQIIVVEPDAAPALIEAVRAGKLQDTHGPVSCMGRLDCKTASMIALAGLARDADMFVTISDADAVWARWPCWQSMVCQRRRPVQRGSRRF